MARERDDRGRDDRDGDRGRGRDRDRDERKGPSDKMMQRYKDDLEDAKRKSGGAGWYKTDGGSNKARFLPGVNPDAPFYVRAGQHFGLGPEAKSSVYCPKIVIGPKEDCPICDFVEVVKAKSKKPRELEMAKKYAVNARIFAQVLDRKKDDDTPLIYSYGTMVHRQVLELLTGEYPDLLDLERGTDLVIKRDGEGLDTKYQVYPARDSKEVDPDVMDKALDLEEYVRVRLFSAKDLERVLEGEDPMKIVRERGGEDDDDAGEADDRDDRRRGRDDDRGDDRDERRSRDRDDRDEPRGRGRDDRDDDRRGGRDRDDRDDRPSRDSRDDRDRNRGRERDEPRGRSRDDDRDDRGRDRDRDDRRSSSRDEKDDRDGRDGYDDEVTKQMDKLRNRGRGDDKDDKKDDRKRR